jgi:UDP:flavonoid glycosyltransferase YjiC (YdhE family)
MHHGGIGTLAQGMASGTPQLIMPMAFDQPDNALRASRLGVARWLSPRKFTTDGVTTVLRDLLESSAVATATATCRDRLARANGVAITCDLLEQESRRTTNHSLVYSPPDPTQP